MFNVSRCHFSRPERTYLSPDDAKRRAVTKCHTTCAFKVRFNYLRKDSKGMKGCIKVTSSQADYNHSCGLSTITQRIAIQRSGCSQPDIDGMRQVICLLRDSYLDNRALRGYLQKSVHSFTDLTDQWLRNFRKKVLKYVIDPNLEFGKNDLPYLQHERTNLANESIVLDSDTKQVNFCNFLRQVLQDAGEGWNVVKLLDKTKES